MMPHPVESLSHIVRMDAFHGEAGQGLEGGRSAGASTRHAGDRGQLGPGALGQGTVWAATASGPAAAGEVEGRAPATAAAMGGVPPRSLGLSAAPQPPSSTGQPCRPRQKPGAARARPASSRAAPHAGEAAHLMGRHPEVGAEGGRVHRLVAGGLGPVEHHHGPGLPRSAIMCAERRLAEALQLD